jgi:hypothetical protein
MTISKKYWKKNLSLLEKINPRLKYQVSTINPEQVEFCETELNEPNLKRTYQGQIYCYHSQKGALEEAFNWFKGLNLHHIDVLYVYGIGLGYYYEAAKAWLKQNPQHMLIFLEEDLSVFYRLFETERGTDLLKDRQVQLIYFQDILTDKALFNELSWTYFSSSFLISSLKLYAEANAEGFLALHHYFFHDAVQKKVLVDEYLQYGIMFFRNFYPNLMALPESYLGNELFGKFKDVPAIICGAGPSLHKNINLLKTLTDRALIFGGGSALNALAAKGIIPHFGAGIDPNKGQYERLQTSRVFNLPFFYRNRFFHEALQAISGPRLYLTGSGGYEISNWFEEQLGITGECLDEGHNIVNFCIEIAHALGCNPIILVGMDLAFTNQQVYAEGVIENSNLSQEHITKNLDFDSELILKKDIYNQPIYTLWKWITESEWTSEFATNHPNLTILNATEGGLGFKGIPNQTLQEVSEKHLNTSYQFKEWIQKEINKYSLSSCRLEKIIELMKTFQQSLIQCAKQFDVLREEMTEIANSIKKGQEIQLSLQSPTVTLLEMEIEENMGYQYLLDIFNSIYVRIHHRTIQDLQLKKQRLSDKKRALKKIDLQLQRLLFLKQVALINIELINRNLSDLEK